MTTPLCPRCGTRLDPVITTPPPDGCGQTRHPLCATGSWWTPEQYALADALLGRAWRGAA